MCSAACYFCLFSCLITRTILWNARNSPAVTVINRDGDGAGKQLTEARMQCGAPWVTEWLRSLSESHLQCGGNTVPLCVPVWVQSGPCAVGAWHCPEGLGAVPRCWAGSGGWEQKLQQKMPCWHFQSATRMGPEVWLSLGTWSYDVRENSELNSCSFWL